MNDLKFGKLAVKNDPHYRTLNFENYLGVTFPTPPTAYSSLTRVYQNLKISDPSVLFPMDGNDRYGDCTFAGVAHASTIYHGLLGKKEIASSRSVIAKYLWLAHGIDNGLNELDVLNYIRKHSVFGEKIGAFVSIKPTNHDQIMLANWLYGGVYIGFQVQENCIKDFNEGKEWTPGPLTQDGHAVFATTYDSSSVSVLTWGAVQRATWSWWDCCVEEAYAILPEEALKPEYAPGFNYSQLLADLKAL